VYKKMNYKEWVEGLDFRNKLGWEHTPEIEEALNVLEYLADQLHKAQHYIGIEIHACPLCIYENGKFIKRCEMHRQIDVLHERLKKYEPEEYYQDNED